MQFTRQQIAIMGMVGILALLIFLMFVGIIPGLRQDRPQEIKADLVFWGIYDSRRDYEGAINIFQASYPEVSVSYRQFFDPARYESELIRAFATGTGPDIFMVPNSGILKNIRFMEPISPDWFPITRLRQVFPDVVEQDFVFNGRIYALPASIDTLALIYNRDIFNQEAIVGAPQTWDDFQNYVLKLTKRGPAGELLRPAAAIGGFGNNIPTVTDILSLLLLQSGSQMVSPDFSRAFFSGAAERSAVEFYIRFSDPASSVYTWNQDLPDARELFAQGGVAMIFDYAGSIKGIKAKNPLLNIGIAKVPQKTGSPYEVSYASYWGYALSNRSRYGNLAGELIYNFTIQERGAVAYANATGKPPALRSLINRFLGQPDMDAFVRQALTARSWQQTDPTRVKKIFSDMIASIVRGDLKVFEALRRAEGQVTDVLRDR